MLKDAIQHNQYVYDQLTSLLTDTVQYYRELDYGITNEAVKNSLATGILRDLYFYDDGSLVRYFPLIPRTKKGLISNIIRVNADSVDPIINRRILELNALYDKIHDITPEFGGENNAYS